MEGWRVNTVSVRPLEDVDRQWAGDQIARQWGARLIVSKGKVYYPDQLPGFVAFQAGGGPGWRLTKLRAAIVSLSRYKVYETGMAWALHFLVRSRTRRGNAGV